MYHFTCIQISSSSFHCEIHESPSIKRVHHTVRSFKYQFKLDFPAIEPQTSLYKLRESMKAVSGKTGKKWWWGESVVFLSAPPWIVASHLHLPTPCRWIFPPRRRSSSSGGGRLMPSTGRLSSPEATNRTLSTTVLLSQPAFRTMATCWLRRSRISFPGTGQ